MHGSTSVPLSTQSPTPPRSRLSFGCGCLIGLLTGAALTGLAAWGAWWAYSEAAREPLLGLKVEKERLTIDETKPHIDDLAKGYLSDKNNVGLVVGIVKDGETRVFGYGSVARDRRQVPDENTLFELASVGKTFTTLVLADMHRKDELRLDDPVEKLLPENVSVPSQPPRKITLLDLATHTSGIPSLPDNFEKHVKDQLNPYKDYSVAALYEDLPRQKLTGPIGKQYDYSNLGMGLLGHVLSLKAGQKYEDLVVTRVCDPLGMTSTRMTLDDSLRARLATPHADGKPVPVWEDFTLPGAGSFLSTAHDMLTYVEAYLSEPETDLQRAMKLCLQKRRPAGDPSMSIGLGWHITSENAVDLIWHNGGAGGSVSFVGFIEPSRVGVVVLSNSTSSVDQLGTTVLWLLHLH